jgi:hypothetical protein
MNRAHRYAASLLLAAVLASPLAVMAVPAPEGATVQIRVYDRHHRDYHNWDDHENHAWGVYLESNHRRHYEYVRAHRRDQDRYWEWRHSHPNER